jgi:2-amino-4-hydroxy-6-hydroxymethyldihydropteridine diphosphokinase
VVVVAFGSNLGSRRELILQAAAHVATFLANFRLSSIIETAPVGPGLENDPPYLNAVGVGESDLSPRQILDRLQAIERAAGRVRPHAGAPRTIDLDLIVAGDRVIDERDLQVPHPRFRERRFVLGPLAELEPDLVDPVSGQTARELLARLTH